MLAGGADAEFGAGDREALKPSGKIKKNKANQRRPEKHPKTFEKKTKIPKIQTRREMLVQAGDISLQFWCFCLF